MALRPRRLRRAAPDRSRSTSRAPPQQPAGGVAAVRLHGRRVLHHPRGGRPRADVADAGLRAARRRLVAVGVTAIIGFHVGWFEGRKFLEIPRPLDYLVVVDVLLFIANIGTTMWYGRRFTTTSLVLFFGLLAAALLYLPGMIPTTNQTEDSYWRWWVVHLWVEGVWELIMGGILVVPAHQAHRRRPRGGREVALRDRRLHVPLRHPRHRAPLLLHRHARGTGCGRRRLQRARAARLPGDGDLRLAMARQGGRNIPTSVALLWTVGCAIMSFVGAGFLGFAHTLPQVNLYTHGTLVTAMHGHMAFWGAYAMIVLGIITYAMPLMTGRKCYQAPSAVLAFWTQQHRHGGDDARLRGGRRDAGVPRAPHRAWTSSPSRRRSRCTSIGLILAAMLFTSGILLFVWNFISLRVAGRHRRGRGGRGGARARRSTMSVREPL